ncbi:MAG TPA: nuclear transport factor 2 family protein, partial [Rhizomicrobium sp.]
SPQVSGAIPVFDFPNPGTGKAVVYPDGLKVVGADRLLPAPAPLAPAAASGSVAQRLAEARRKLAVAKAYDAVENVSNTFGYYLDDTMWDQMAEIFAIDGTRPQGPGFYVGHKHILEAMTQTHYSGPPSPTNPRDHINIHQRLQPVIEIAPDGATAKVRTRLFLYHASQKGNEASTFSTGMYPNETFTLEGGVWKMQVGGEIDETYIRSSSWKDGWGRVPERSDRAGTGDAGWRPGMPAPMTGITNTIDFPPDIPRTVLDDYRWKGMQNTNWPDIKPMWFAYRNPVSGRTPPNYCADILKCGGF